jgi:hypothetical protein
LRFFPLRRWRSRLSSASELSELLLLLLLLEEELLLELELLVTLLLSCKALELPPFSIAC